MAVQMFGQSTEVPANYLSLEGRPEEGEGRTGDGAVSGTTYEDNYN